ncbi:MAG: ADP-ribosylation factor-like protein [Promethearchaeia archaeon]
MQDRSNIIKVVISGLDFAGKTSILTALDNKFDFLQEIEELRPTVKVKYHKTDFLGNQVYFWDMGGQKKYRATYIEDKDMYFADIDLFLYVIDIQDEEAYAKSLNYLDSIMNYFKEEEMDIPVIVTFHKMDPEIRNNQKLLHNMEELQQKISERYSSFQLLFQSSSIFDIISIIQLISYGLSVFDKKFFELSELLEVYTLDEFECQSLILFDKNGIIVSEFYSQRIEPEIYVELLESIKEHLYLLKRMKEEEVETDFNFFMMEDNLVSYLHRITVNDHPFYVSVLLEKQLQDNLTETFPDFLEELTVILKDLV